MRTAVGLLAALVIWGFGPDSVNFDAVKPGTIPPNWTFLSNRPQEHNHWEVRYDRTAPSRGNVLEKSAGNVVEGDAPIAVFDRVVCRDGDLSVKFRIDSSGRSHTAGIVWRFVDQNNYYLLHFSADQKDIVLVRVVNGRREPIPITSDKQTQTWLHHDIDVGQWYVAKVSFRGDKIRGFFGNRQLFEANDAGISGPGKTGVWTRGRTTASFDDFKIDKKS